MNKAESTIPVSLLRELIRMEPDGTLFWKARAPRHFQQGGRHTPTHRANNWNSMYAGTPALNCMDPSQHLMGRINNKLIYAHRAAYALTHGAWPINSIDHINGIAFDNRPENLRDVPHKTNLRNRKLDTRNTTGAMGVNWFKRDSKWVASITVDGRSIHLGYFNEFSDAVTARKAADAKHGFHPNHGRKA